MNGSLPTGASAPTAGGDERPGGGGSGDVDSVTGVSPVFVLGTAADPIVTVGVLATTPQLVGSSGSPGAAANLARGDHVHGGGSADWNVANVRWYALDGVSGNDANAGFSDVSAAAAGLVAVQTAARLDAILPCDGRGRHCIVMIRSTSYSTQNTNFAIGRYGYKTLTMRATVTNADASSVAFLDDTADRTMCGGVTCTGTNAAGYNPTGVPTTRSIRLLQVGGAAPGFAAEPALPGGARLRFSATTTTVALRNVKRTIVQVTGTNTIEVGLLLPAVPVAADVCFIEMPGALFNQVIAEGEAANNSGFPYVIAGLQSVGVTVGNRGFQIQGFMQAAFCWHGPSSSTMSGRGTMVSFNSSYVTGTTGTLVDTGGACRSGSLLLAAYGMMTNASGQSPYVVGAINTERVSGAEIPSASVAGGGMNIWGNVMPSSYADSDHVGTGSSSAAAGYRAARIIGAGTGTAGLIPRGSINIALIEITGMGAKPAIQPLGRGSSIRFQAAVFGATGNTDVGLDLTNARGCTIILDAIPTVTGTAGNVRLSDGSIITWAVAAAGVVDPGGNIIFASPNSPLKPTAVANGAVVVGLGAVGPAGSAATPVRWVRIPDGAGGFFTYPSFT